MTGAPAGRPAGDDGGPDARLAAALAGDDGSPGARGEVFAALATARVFLALQAHAAAASSTASVALVSLVAPGGQRALPAFLAAAQVSSWRAQARPAPVSGPLACRAALDDGAAAVLLDPAGAAVAVSGPALAELAHGRVPVPGAALSTRQSGATLHAPADADPALLAALARALAPEAVPAARLLAGPDGPVLGVVASLAPARLAALAERVRVRLGGDLPAGGLDLAAVDPDGPGLPVPLVRAPGRWWRRVSGRRG